MSLDPLLGNSSDGTLPFSLKVGMKLFQGQYELVELLGAGGMGQVWRARDVTEGIDVALKFLPGLIVLQPVDMQRLKDEVAVGKGLRHDHLVATYGLEVESSMAAIVMEYVPGQTLKSKLEHHPRGFFEPAELHGWLADIAEALDYLHVKKQRIHRDVKPANIMIDAEGRARLIDFGISHQIQASLSRHSKTGVSSSAGGDASSTLAYAGPQQLAGLPGAAADDLYSLGATVYELLTSTPPFFRGGPEIVAYQIKSEPPAAMLTRRQEQVQDSVLKTTGSPVPPQVEQAVRACLEKAREKRPATAGEVLRRFTGGKTRSGPRSPFWRIAAVLTLAGLGWAVWPRPVPTAPPNPQIAAAQAEVLRLEKEKAAALAAAKEATEKMLAAQSAPPPPPPKAAPVLATPATATMSDPFTNDLGMKFVPTLTYTDGSKVLFCIWETRSKDYAVFVKETRHDAGEDWKTYTYGDNKTPVGRGANETAEESLHPVANVSHDDGVAFCAWLTKKDRASGKIGPKDEYRLPTDMEWSYAVGIGEKEDPKASPKEKDGKLAGIYPWGTSSTPPDKAGNYADEDANAKGVDTFGLISGYHDGYATTAPVGSYRPNNLGIYDLGGNLWEWTSSEWESGSASRVLRGGSWGIITESDLLSSYRYCFPRDLRNLSIGFRCVLVVGGGG
jgi:serine/threonine protein kinase